MLLRDALSGARQPPPQLPPLARDGAFGQGRGERECPSHPPRGSNPGVELFPRAWRGPPVAGGEGDVPTTTGRKEQPPLSGVCRTSPSGHGRCVPVRVRRMGTKSSGKIQPHVCVDAGERGSLERHHTAVCGRGIASTGMFEIKPRERQLRGGAPQPVGVTLWGAQGGCCLPPSSPWWASLAEGLAACVAAPRTARPRVPVPPCFPPPRVPPLRSSSSAPGLPPAGYPEDSRGDGMQRGSARGSRGVAPAVRLLLQSTLPGNKSRRSATRKSLSRGAPQLRLSRQPRREKSVLK